MCVGCGSSILRIGINNLGFLASYLAGFYLALLVAEVAVRRNLAAYHAFAQTIAGIYLHFIRVLVDGIDRKKNTGFFTFDHFLNDNGKCHGKLVVTLIAAVTDRAVSPERSITVSYLCEHGFRTADI